MINRTPSSWKLLSFVSIWMIVKVIDGSSTPTPSLQVSFRMRYEAAVEISKDCGKKLYETRWTNKFKETNLSKVQKLCTDAGHNVALTWEETGTSTFIVWTLAEGNIIIKGATREAMSSCMEIISPFLADRANILKIFPTLDKVSVPLCPEATLDARALTVFAFFFTCDAANLFYYDSKAFSCIFREDTVNYPNTIAKSVQFTGHFDATSPPTTLCQDDAAYSVVLAFSYILPELSKICPGYEHIEHVFLTFNVSGELAKTNIQLKTWFMPASWATSKKNLQDCFAKIDGIFTDRGELDTMFPKFMSGSYGSKACPAFKLNTGSTFEMTDVAEPDKMKCMSTVNKEESRSAEYVAGNGTCNLPKVNPCPEGEATKCLDDFSKDLVTLLTTSNPDTNTLCSTIQANKDCISKAPAFCLERYKAGMEVYIKRAEMLCMVKQGWMADPKDSDPATCVKADIAIAIQGVRATAVSLVKNASPQPMACNKLKRSVSDLTQKIVTCSTHTQELSIDLNQVNLDAIGVACPDLGRTTIIGQCQPTDAIICVWRFKKLALDASAKVKACSARKGAFSCTDTHVLGCPRTYRTVYHTLVDETAQNIDGCSHYTETCNVVAIRKGVDDVIRSARRVDQLSDASEECMAMNTKVAGVTSLTATCGEEIKLGVSTSLDGHTASARYKCSSKMPAACGQDPAMRCMRKLAKDTTSAFIDRTGSSTFCASVNSATSRMCVSKANTACKALPIYSILTATEAKLIDGAKKACTANIYRIQNSLCQTRSAKDWLGKYAERAVFDGVTSNADLKQVCSGMTEALKFAYQDMTMCTDDRLNGGKAAMVVLQSLLKKKCPGWNWPKFPSAVKTRISRSSINITEGAEDGPVPITFINSPAAICYNLTNCKIEIDVSVQSDMPPNFITTMAPVEQVVVGKYSAANKDDFCKFTFTPEIQKKETSIPLMATIERKIDGLQTRDFILKYKQTVGDQVIASREISRTVTYVKDRDFLAVCEAVGDPHISTFDGLYYHNYLSGIFTMYKHEIEPIEVQILTYKCYPQGTCICAVAIQSGDDVIVLDRCKEPKREGPMRFNATNSKPDSKMFHEERPYYRWFYVQGNRSKGTRIYEQKSGQVIEVKLPKGTIVHVNVHATYMSVQITPAPNDYFQTFGLCGKYNKKKEDDLETPDMETLTLPTDGSLHPTKFINAWRVDPVKSVFKGVPEDDTIVDLQDTYCVCNENKPGVCTANGQMRMKDLHWSTAMNDVTEQWASYTQNYITKFGKTIGVMDYIDHVIDSDFLPQAVAWSQVGSGWTEQKAVSFCDSYLKKRPEVEACRKVPTYSSSFDRTMASCVEDIKLTGNTSFAVDALGSYIYGCANMVSVNFSLADSQLGGNIMSSIVKGSCLGTCNSYGGSCEDGKCKCTSSWVNEDCSASLEFPPKSFRLQNNGLCDTTKDSCGSSSVFGGGLIHNDDLSIVLEKVEWSSQGPKRSNAVVTVPGKRIAFNEVEFNLPEPGQGYIVGISNDKGKTYGTLLPFMPHDPATQKCYPSWGICLAMDTCPATDNYKCFEALTNNALDIAGNVTKFQTACTDLKTKKDCITANVTDKCTTVQMQRMASYVETLETRILGVCADKYKNVLTVDIPKVVIPSTCDTTGSEGLIADFFKIEYKSLLAADNKDGKLSQASCAKLAKEVQRIVDSMATCPDLTKSQMAQALNYPRGLAEGSCTDVKWPPWPLLTDTCPATDNYKCFEALTNNALDIAGNVTKFQTACTDLKTKKDCITANVTDKCTTVQMQRMASYVETLETRIMGVCADKYKNVLTVDIPKVVIPSTCDTTGSEGLIADFFKIEYKSLLAADNKDGKLSQASCAKLAKEVQRIVDSMATCPDLTKSQMAQALNYPRGLAEGSCTDVKWPPWPLLTEAASTCAKSEDFSKLDQYVKDATTLSTQLGADTTALCSKFAADLKAIASATAIKGCDAKQLEMMKKLAADTEAIIKARCDKGSKTETASPTCNPKEAADGLTNAISTLTHTLVYANNTDELCLNYVNAIREAKHLMYSCSEASKKALEETLSYLNGNLVPKLCSNYIDVPWPVGLTSEFEQKITVEPPPHPGVTIAEGKANTSDSMITVKWTSDPSTVCKGKVDCSVVVEIGFPQCSSSSKGLDSKIAQLSVQWPMGSPNKGCEIPITSNSWKTQTFPLAATMDMLYDSDKTCHAVISYKKKVKGKVETLGEIGRIQVVANNMDKKAVCTFDGNMLTTTFDGHFYNNFLSGFFVAYKHKTLPYQVQIAVTDCEPKTTCICAAAVQSGDDVLVVDRCPRKDTSVPSGKCVPGACVKPNKPPMLRTKLYKNGELTPMTKIYNRQGQDYKIVLPTTATVDILVTGSAINVIISPSPKDFLNTKGLCGLFDSNAEKDFLRADGTAFQPLDFMEAQRIATVKDSIFYGVKPEPMGVISYCQCIMSPGKPNSPNCSPTSGDFSNVNWDKSFKDVTDVVNWTAEESAANLQSLSPRSLPSITVNENPPPANLNLPKGNWTTEAQIIKFCAELVNDTTTYYSDVLNKCQDVPGANMTRIRNSCLYGIKRTGDTRFVKDAIGTAIESCRNNMIKMPQANGTPPVFPKTCPLGCSGNGKCETGVCKCKVGYGNSDCSIETTKQPAFMSVEPRSTCDVRKRNCSVLLINGENLRDKPECVFEEIKVFTDKPFERTGTVTRLPATYDNNNQVYCHGNQPPKPGIYHPIPKDPSTNTWLHAGPVYMPFDSLCFDCNIGALTCKPKKSSCYVDGKCYAAGKDVGGKTGCHVCDPTVASDKLVASKDEKACQLPTASAHGSHKETKEIGPMWWILLILLGLLLLCFAVLCCILCCFCGKNRGRYTHHERKEVFENMKANSIFAGIRCSEKPAEDDEFNATFVHEDEVVLAERNHSESMIGRLEEETMAADDWSATSGVDLEEEGGEYNATFVHEDEVVAAERQHVESMIGRHQERTMTVNDGSATLEEEGGEYNAALVFEDEVVVAERQHVESGTTLEEDVMAASVGCVASEPPQPYHGLLVHEQTQVVIKQKNKSMSFFGHGGFARSSLHLKPGGPARSSLRLQVPDEDAKGLCNDQTSLEGQATREEKGSPCLNVSDHIELDDFSADHLDQGDKEHSYIAFSHGFPHDAPAIVGDHWHEWEEGEIIQEMEFGSEFGSRASTPCDYVQGAEVSEETNQVSTYHLGLSQNHQANIHHDGTLRICRSPTPTFVVTAPEEESGLHVPSPRPCDGSRQPSPGPFDGSRGPSPRIYTSNTMYTDGGASESTFDSSAHHATSIYEANIDTEHEGVEDQDVRTSKPVHVLQNKKVYLGALVQGKLLNKAQHDQPLHDEYDRPDDMNINPLFDDDDGVQQGYAYVSTSQANPQVDGHHAQYVTPSYGADAKMYTRQKVTHPLETLFIDTRPKLVSPQSPELIRTVSPPTVFTKPTLVVDTPTESVDVDSPSSPRRFVAHSYVTTSSRPATPGSATYSMESRRTVPSDHSTELKNDEYYFVDSEALETLNIPDESVEDYVYANRGELVGTQQSET